MSHKAALTGGFCVGRFKEAQTPGGRELLCRQPRHSHVELAIAARRPGAWDFKAALTGGIVVTTMGTSLVSALQLHVLTIA